MAESSRAGTREHIDRNACVHDGLSAHAAILARATSTFINVGVARATSSDIALTGKCTDIAVGTQTVGPAGKTC